MSDDDDDDKVPVPVCELCWLIEHTSWEPESMDENGRVLMRLTGVAVPEKVKTDSVEICAICGSITVCGIYEFKHPSEVEYIDPKEPDNTYLYDEDDPTVFVINLENQEDLEEDSEG